MEDVIDSSMIFFFFSFDLKCFNKASLVVEDKNWNLSSTDDILFILNEWEKPKNSE